MARYHILITTIIAVIFLKPPIIVQSWDQDFIKEFLFPIAEFVKPQDVVWFISEQMNATYTVGLKEFMLDVNTHYGLPQVVLTNRTDLHLSETELKKNILSIVFTTAPTDPIMHVHDEALLGRHFTCSFIIVVNTVMDFAVIEQFLYDLNRRNFHSPLLYYTTADGRNEVFGFYLFPEYAITNRSNYFASLSESYDRFMAGGLNAFGFKLYTPLRQDLPGVFHAEGTNGISSWQGSTFNLLKLFTDYINATLVSYEMPKDCLGGDIIDMKGAMDLLRTGEINLLAHAYALFYELDGISLSYPITVVRWCLMVPMWNSVTTMFYPLEPFDDFTWFGIVCVFGALLVVQCLWCCLEGSHQLAARLSDGFLRSFCVSTGISAPSRPGTPSLFDFFIFTTFFFYGFFLTANYTSLLGSILTVTLFRTQINTMDDLIKANITVMIIDYELEFLLSGGDELPENFMRLILPVDSATFVKHQFNFNKSYAYFVTEEKWHFLELQQQYLKQRIFKFSKICFGSFFLAFPIKHDSFLMRSLEYYIYRMHSSGMLQHYESTAFDYAVHAGLVKRLTDNIEYTSAGMQHLTVVFLMHLAMFVLSSIIFVGEFLSFRAVKRRIKPA